MRDINDPVSRSIPWPDPTSEMVINDPEFEAIWQCIKSWDINVPEAYGGYCGATGNHVRAILDALRKAKEAEIKRLRAENERLWTDVEHLQAPTNVEIMLSDAKTEIKRLREALLAAKDHIGNGYQPPDLIKQIDSALKQSG